MLRALSEKEFETRGWPTKYRGKYDFGYYDKGRYAWQLDDVEQIDEPMTSKGQQGLWNWGGERDAIRQAT